MIFTKKAQALIFSSAILLSSQASGEQIGIFGVEDFDGVEPITQPWVQPSGEFLFSDTHYSHFSITLGSTQPSQVPGYFFDKKMSDLQLNRPLSAAATSITFLVTPDKDFEGTKLRFGRLGSEVANFYLNGSAVASLAGRGEELYQLVELTFGPMKKGELQQFTIEYGGSNGSGAGNGFYYDFFELTGDPAPPLPPEPEPPCDGRTTPVTWHVSPDGNDSASGMFLDEPLQSINEAHVKACLGGDVIAVHPGIYIENVVTQFNGTLDAQIELVADPGAFLYSANAGKPTFRIKNSNYKISGLRISGFSGYEGSSAAELDYFDSENYSKQALFVKEDQPLDNVSLFNVSLTHAGSECVKLVANHSSMKYSDVSYCGMWEMLSPEINDATQGVQVGDTSAEQITHVTLVDNFLSPNADIAIQVLNASNITLTKNLITASSRAGSGAVDMRARDSVLEDNRVVGNNLGIRIDAPGVSLKRNTLIGNQVGLKIKQNLAEICETTFEGNEQDLQGATFDVIDPEKPCNE